MKKIQVSILVLVLSVIGPLPSYAQFFDFVKKKAEKAVNKAVDTSAEEVTQSAFNKDDDEADDKETSHQNQENSAKTSQNESKSASRTPKLNWARYDFVPGDEIIFDDMPSQDEENGEFPSRWDLGSGSVEIAEVDGEKVIMFRASSSKIVPYLKDSDKDYLPEVFTIEFDIYRPAKTPRFHIYFWDSKNQRRPRNIKHITVGHDYMYYGSNRSKYPKKINTEKGRWLHVSIAYTKGKLKAYFDDVRLLNLPRLEANPSGFSISCSFASDKTPYFMKNVRIAKGGVKYYDRVLTDGKIIVNGIKFDVGKATLRPESIGPINKIYSLMKKHSDIKFSVEGHTDSDGDDAVNQTLSEERAKAVMDELIKMGLSSERLKFKGFGESKPIDTNGTKDGKANNRRVEFVKM